MSIRVIIPYRRNMEILDQAYFWTKEWQEAEAEADEDIKSGRVTRYSTVEELIADLHKRSLPLVVTTCDLKTGTSGH